MQKKYKNFQYIQNRPTYIYFFFNKTTHNRNYYFNSIFIPNIYIYQIKKNNKIKKY